MSSYRWLEHVDNRGCLFCCRDTTTVLITSWRILLIAGCVVSLLTAAVWEIGLWNCSDCETAAQNSGPARSIGLCEEPDRWSFRQSVGCHYPPKLQVIGWPIKKQPNLGVKLKLCFLALVFFHNEFRIGGHEIVGPIKLDWIKINPPRKYFHCVSSFVL